MTSIFNNPKGVTTEKELEKEEDYSYQELVLNDQILCFICGERIETEDFYAHFMTCIIPHERDKDYEEPKTLSDLMSKIALEEESPELINEFNKESEAILAKQIPEDYEGKAKRKGEDEFIEGETVENTINDYASKRSTERRISDKKRLTISPKYKTIFKAKNEEYLQRKYSSRQKFQVNSNKIQSTKLSLKKIVQNDLF